MAQEIQAEINGAKSLAGRQVVVGLAGNKLTITSNTYGSASQVRIGTGSALPLLGFAGTELGQGTDVAGRFIVDGKIEAARGTGQLLQGLAWNANTADLIVRASLTAEQIVDGTDATLTVTRGVGSRLNNTLTNLLDPISGRFKIVTDNMDTQIQDLQKQMERQNQLIQRQHDALVAQFASLESTVSQLQTAGGFLANQAAQFSRR